jgi:hypothetical protein
MCANDLFLPEADWLFLSQEIHNRQVIPIVGPELVTIPKLTRQEPAIGA